MSSSLMLRESRARTALDSFSSTWFLVPQGTGILAVILHQLDYQFRGLGTISVIFWLMNIIMLLGFLAVYLARFIASPVALFRAITTDTTEAACLSSISIAFTSIIQMLSLVVVPSWGGKSWANAAYVMWWINCFMAVVAVFGLLLLIIHNTQVQGGFIKDLTPVSQLPLIAAITSAAGAGTLCQSTMLSPAQQVPMIVVAYLEIGVALPTALVLDILYLSRILSPLDNEIGVGSLKGAKMYSEMVLCGPWGQSSFALQGLGMALFKLQESQGIYPTDQPALLLSNQILGPVASTSMFMGLILWGHGTFWWVFAIVRIIQSASSHLKRESGLPFGLSTWSLVFPWGVYTKAAVQLGKLLNSPAFKVWSTVLTLILVVIWLLCAGFTLRGILLGTLLGQRRGWNKNRQPS